MDRPYLQMSEIGLKARLALLCPPCPPSGAVAGIAAESVAEYVEGIIQHVKKKEAFIIEQNMAITPS